MFGVADNNNHLHLFYGEEELVKLKKEKISGDIFYLSDPKNLRYSLESKVDSELYDTLGIEFDRDQFHPTSRGNLLIRINDGNLKVLFHPKHYEAVKNILLTEMFGKDDTKIEFTSSKYNVELFNKDRVNYWSVGRKVRDVIEKYEGL